jgi:predicted membrane protein
MWCGIPAVIPWEEIMMVTSLKRKRWEYCSNTVTVNKPAELCWSTCTCTQYTVMPQAVKWPAMYSKCVGTSVLTVTVLRSSQISFSCYWQLFHSVTHTIYSCSSLIHGCVNQLKRYFFEDLYFQLPTYVMISLVVVVKLLNLLAPEFYI